MANHNCEEISKIQTILNRLKKEQQENMNEEIVNKEAVFINRLDFRNCIDLREPYTLESKIKNKIIHVYFDDSLSADKPEFLFVDFLRENDSSIYIIDADKHFYKVERFMYDIQKIRYSFILIEE